MKFIKVLFICLIFNINASAQKDLLSNLPIKYAETITKKELKQHLYKYASNEFEGRDTGSKGQKLAVNYLKDNYELLNIKPALENNYFQNVPLKLIHDSKGFLNINNKYLKENEDFLIINKDNDFRIETKSISILDVNNTYEKESLANTVIFVKALKQEKNKNFSSFSLYKKTIEKLNKLKPKAIILYDKDIFKIYKRHLSNNTHNKLFIDANKSEIPIVLINQNNLIEANTSISIEIKVNSTPVSTENVAAFIKGSEKPNEIVIISAHLDHIGTNKNGIYNGADDDGSGTVAILEIAEAFKKAALDGHQPKRSLLFLHVTGEEKGLLGSKYYTDYSPIFPLNNTVVDLNIDMIGRIDPKRKGDRNYIYLIGSDRLSNDLHEISEKANNKYCNITLDYKYNVLNDPNRFYERSDHYNFAKHNIPVIFYFNGVHDDYHQPSDTPDKIQYDLLENRTRLIFYTAWEIANRKNRIELK
jgi:hypothetical protein